MPSRGEQYVGGRIRTAGLRKNSSPVGETSTGQRELPSFNFDSFLRLVVYQQPNILFNTTRVFGEGIPFHSDWASVENLAVTNINNINTGT